MENLQKLHLNNRSEFTNFLEAAKQVNDSSIVRVNNNTIRVVTSSPDNTLILYSTLKQENDVKGDITLNVPSIGRLVRAINGITTPDICFNINSNNIEYVSSGISFVYHLLDDGFITEPAVSEEKIEKFNWNIHFVLTKEQIQLLKNSSSFASTTNKLYFLTKGGCLFGNLTDQTRHNVDSICLNLGEVDFELKSICLNFDHIRSLMLVDSNIHFYINTDISVVIVDILRDNIKLKYLITTLV